MRTFVYSALIAIALGVKVTEDGTEAWSTMNKDKDDKKENDAAKTAAIDTVKTDGKDEKPTDAKDAASTVVPDAKEVPAANCADGTKPATECGGTAPPEPSCAAHGKHWKEFLADQLSKG